MDIKTTILCDMYKYSKVPGQLFIQRYSDAHQTCINQRYSGVEYILTNQVQCKE